MGQTLKATNATIQMTQMDLNGLTHYIFEFGNPKDAQGKVITNGACKHLSDSELNNK